MGTSLARESTVLDAVDARIVRALQLNPRAGFATIADVLGLSEQTVARRYRRLRRAGIVRVLGVVNPAALGQSTWVVRVRCRPDGTTSLAEALARREDVAWVALSAGGSEITFSVRSRTREQRDHLLVQRLPRTAPVLDIQASVLLHQFVGGRSDDWAGLSARLTGAETARLGATEIPVPSRTTRPITLEPHDDALLATLMRDGRASYAELAAASGLSEGRATRRVAALIDSGAVYIDVDLAAAAMGFTTQANLWMRVAPSALHAAGTALQKMPQVAFAGATSGQHNLSAAVICRTLDELYAFTTEQVGALEGVQTLEVSPVLRHVKQSGALTEGDRLAPPE